MLSRTTLMWMTLVFAAIAAVSAAVALPIVLRDRKNKRWLRRLEQPGGHAGGHAGGHVGAHAGGHVTGPPVVGGWSTQVQHNWRAGMV